VCRIAGFLTTVWCTGGWYPGDGSGCGVAERGWGKMLFGGIYGRVPEPPLPQNPESGLGPDLTGDGWGRMLFGGIYGRVPEPPLPQNPESGLGPDLTGDGCGRMLVGRCDVCGILVLAGAVG